MLEKNPRTVHKMFGEIAGRYDFANDFLSLGWHRRWRKQALSWSPLQEGDRVLDAATGTGDMAFLFHKKVGPKGKVTACDFCEPMLEGARARQKKQQQQKQKQHRASSSHVSLEFVQADIMNLPFKNSQFDLSNISFGIRNVQDPLQALKEMARVTQPRGFVLILEFGQMHWPLLKKLYGFYQKRLLPHLGSLITGVPRAYRYLEASSSQFPCGEDFLKLMQQSQRFSSIEARPLTGGMVYLYRGQVKR